MKNASKIHRASVEAFIEYLKRSGRVGSGTLIKRMWYNIGWPVETIVYVIHNLVEAGYYPPIDIDQIRRELER